MKNKIWLSPPHMGDKEEKYVKEAFEQNWIAPVGPHLNQFEAKIAKISGAKFAVALSSGTAAIHLALLTCGVKSGDEVICPTFTFNATINPILYIGATPVFVESEKQTWNICPDIMESAIKDRLKKGKKPAAILPVHIYGMPANMKDIISVAEKFEIPIIEDAAEALGAKIDGKMAGAIGKSGIYSFNGNKIITTSGGGVLVTNDDKIAKNVLLLATQAKEPENYLLHREIGFNYRMSNICAAIGLGQTEVLDHRIQRRRTNFLRYFKNLSEIFRFPLEPDNVVSNRWLTCIYNEGKAGGEIMRKWLDMENIEARRLWNPMHNQPVFSHFPYYGNRFSELLFAKGLCLPSGTQLKDHDIDRISQIIINRI